MAELLEINAEFDRASSVTGMFTDLLVVIKGQCSDSATEGAVDWRREEGGGRGAISYSLRLQLIESE